MISWRRRRSNDYNHLMICYTINYPKSSIFLLLPVGSLQSLSSLLPFLLQPFLSLHTEYLQKLLLTDLAIMILINLLEDLADFFLRMLLILQKRGYLIIRDKTWMIHIEIGEGLFEVFLAEFLRLQGCYCKLSEVYLTWVICVDYPHQKVYPIFAYLLPRF